MRSSPFSTRDELSGAVGRGAEEDIRRLRGSRGSEKGHGRLKGPQWS